jgi:hypothetical protein
MKAAESQDDYAGGDEKYAEKNKRAAEIMHTANPAKP